MKRVLAIAVAMMLLTGSLLIATVHADDEMLKVEIADGTLTVTVEGDFGSTDWIGFYPASQAGDYVGSILWWYVGPDGDTWVLPDDAYVVSRNTPGVFDDDGELVPGEYCVILLANDGYEPLDDMEPVFFEIKDPQEAGEPTEVPTEAPTEAPTVAPAEVPATETPTEAPTEAPTAAPTEAPTEVPATEAPTEDPATDAPAKTEDAAAPTAAPATEQGGNDQKDDQNDKKGGANTGLIIGIVCGVVVVAAAIAAVLILRKKAGKGK